MDIAITIKLMIGGALFCGIVYPLIWLHRQSTKDFCEKMKARQLEVIDMLQYNELHRHCCDRPYQLPRR